MAITLRQLEIFLGICSHQTVTRAAESLYISQSAASTALMELERLLRGPLFDRVGRGLVLNDRGRILLPQALELTRRVEELETSLIGGEELRGHLNIGASTTIGNYVLPDLLGRFYARHRHVEISLFIGNSEQVVEELKAFRSDLAFIEGPVADSGIRVLPWQDDELLVFSHPDHPLAQEELVEIQDLENEPWVLREKGSGTREVFERAVSGKLDNLWVKMELGNSEAVKKAVINGIGLGCLSRRALAYELESGRIKPLCVRGLDLGRKLIFLQHRSKYTTRLMQAFMDATLQMQP